MTNRFSMLAGALAVLALGAGAAPALAGVTKTWVSSTTGDDAGSCQFTTPCKTFAFAITQTLPGGEIDVKDGGSYGPVTISQAVSIVNQGFLAAISVPSGGAGITVSAGSGDKVSLEGLTVDGHGVGRDGIDYTSGSSLKINNCRIKNATNIGISLQPVGAQSVEVSNTEVANSGSYGILLQPSNSHPLSSFFGLDLHNNVTGFFVGYATSSLTSSNIDLNSIGIGTEIDGAILLGNTVVSGNTAYGIQTQGGTISSYGDNDINGNGVDISGSFGTIAKH